MYASSLALVVDCSLIGCYLKRRHKQNLRIGISRSFPTLHHTNYQDVMIPSKVGRREDVETSEPMCLSARLNRVFYSWVCIIHVFHDEKVHDNECEYPIGQLGLLPEMNHWHHQGSACQPRSHQASSEWLRSSHNRQTCLNESDTPSSTQR